MSTTDTDRFRGELLKRREHLQATIANHDIGGSSQSDETGELGSSSADNHLADTASETYEREFEEGLEEDATRQLQEVEKALARIEDGTYGTCEVCGKEIPAERLEAIPWTTLCIEDARKLAR
jgi:RNA polymerase-binding protein DksA